MPHSAIDEAQQQTAAANRDTSASVGVDTSLPCGPGQLIPVNPCTLGGFEAGHSY